MQVEDIDIVGVELAQGSVEIGDHLGAGLSEGQSIALVRRALDLGVNFLDTAIAYGTEGIVGKAIKGRPRESVVVSTKSHINALDGSKPMPTSAVVANLEASLKALDTDYVDFFHLHGLWPNF